MRVRGIVLLVLCMDHIAINILVEDVDASGRELACADAALKEQVEFGERAATRLGHAEVCVNGAEEANCGLRVLGQESRYGRGLFLFPPSLFKTGVRETWDERLKAYQKKPV
jgi:hypothetical protein